MATLRDLRTLVQREVMDCPPFIIDTALNKGARAFLEISRFWRKEIQVNTAVGDHDVEIVAPSETDVIEIISVQHIDTGNYLHDASAKQVRQLRSDTPGRPGWFASDSGEVIEFLPIPDAVYSLTVEVAVRPLLSSMTVDDVVIRKCAEGIALAAVADLRSQPGHGWSDPVRAQMDEGKWRSMAWNLWHKKEGGFTGTDQFARPAFGWI